MVIISYIYLEYIQHIFMYKNMQLNYKEDYVRIGVKKSNMIGTDI